MPYCTVSLKLLSPTGHKKQQLEDAMDRYASAFECLLRCVRPKIEGHICSKAEIAAQINLYMPKVDPLGVQPFKDALKRDVAKTLYLYTVQKQKGSRKRYPMLQSNDEDLTQLLMRKSQLPLVLWIIGWNAITDRGRCYFAGIAKQEIMHCCMIKHRIDTTQNSIFSMPSRLGKRSRSAKGSCATLPAIKF